MAQQTKTRTDRWYDKAITWLLYSLGFGVPVIFSTSFYSNFAAPKLLLLRVITLAVIILWIWKSYIEERFSYRRGKFNLGLLAYGAVLVLSTVTSSNVFSSLLGTETRFLGLFTQLNFLLIAWMVYNFITTKKQIKTFITIVCVTGIGVLTAYGWMQYFGLFQDSFAWSQNPQERVFGTLGHSNHFGAYIGMCILLAFGVVPFLKNKIIQRILVVCAHAAFLVVLLTGSRAALVATVLSLLTVCIILGIRSQALRKFMKRMWVAFVVAAAVIAGIIFIFREPLGKLPVIQRMQQGVESAESGFPPDRLSWWMSSVDMVKDRPLLGFGLGTFRDMYSQYRRNDYRVPGPGDIQYQITPESSHNDYIDILVTEGFLGLAVYLGLLFIVFSAIDKKIFLRQKPDEMFYVTLGIKGALMVYLIQVIANFGVVDTLTIFFLLLGAGMSSVSREEKTAAMGLKPMVKELAVCVLLVGVIWCGFFTAREALAEYNYKNAIIEESLGHPENARLWFDEILRNQPYRYEYYEAFGDFAFKNGTQTEFDTEYTKQYLQLALQNYQNASVINKFHPSTFYNMGVTSMQLSHLEQNDAYMVEGINSLQQAIKLSPNNPLYAYQAAKIFAQIGRKDLAVKSFTEVVRLNPQYMDAQKRLDDLKSATQ